jgi:hypothetical protein
MVSQRNSPLGIFTPGPFFPGFFARVYAEHAGSHSHSHSTSGAYMPFSWEEVRPLPDGEWETWATARTGSEETYNPAYEFNDADVADGSVVWLWYGDSYVDASGQQIWDMRFVAGEADGAGSGSGSGNCDCPEFCQAFLVPSGSTFETMYMRFENCCLTISDVPCGSAAGDVNCDNCPAMTGFGEAEFQWDLNGDNQGTLTYEFSENCDIPYTHVDTLTGGPFYFFQLCMTQEAIDAATNACGWVLSDFAAAPRMWTGVAGAAPYTEWELVTLQCDPLEITFTGPDGTVTIRSNA